MTVFAAIQTASYIFTIGLFLLVSPLTVYTRLQTQPVERIAPTSLGAWVYYIGEDRVSVWRVRLDGSRRERMADADADKGSWGGGVISASER